MSEADPPPALLPVQVVVKIRCPVCRGERLKNNGRPRGGSMRFYACLEPSCVARFKVQVVDPLAPNCVLDPDAEPRGRAPRSAYFV